MQYKIAQWISDFAGSMKCVYLHTIWFVGWFLLGLDINVLTLIVSLEAIYLSTFIMINQNRTEEVVEKFVVEDKAQDEELEEDLEDLQENIEDVTEDVDEIQKDVDEVQQDIDEIQEDIGGIEKDIEQIHKDLAEIKEILLKQASRE